MPSATVQEFRKSYGNKYKSPEIVQTVEFNGNRFHNISSLDKPSEYYEIVRTQGELHAAVTILASQDVVAVDTETTGLDPYTGDLLMVQIATRQVAYIIDPGLDFTALKELVLENPVILKLLQNGKFDYKWLKMKKGVELKGIFDTYLAQRLLTAGLGYDCNLAALYLHYFDEPLDKSVRASFLSLRSLEKASKEQLEYAAKDVAVLFGIYSKQLEKLRWYNLLQIADLEFRCITPVAEMELSGVLVDEVKWRVMIADLTDKRNTAEHEIMSYLPGGNIAQSSLFGEPEYLLNLRSGDQVKKEFKKLGITLESTAAAEIEKVDHPAARRLLEFKKLEKSVSSFGESVLKLINPVTGRLHPDFIQYGADTGRFSAANPNVQQIPSQSDFRSCFVPKKGHKLVTCDYSGCELRLLAQFSGDPIFVKTFNDGGDLHRVAAAQMFGVDMDDLEKNDKPKYKEYRSAAKAINFGLAYGMGPQGLAIRIDKSIEESKQLIDTYFKEFKGVKTYLDQSGQFAVNTLYSMTSMGRRRFYRKPETNEERGHIERQGKNAPIQAANADMTKSALVFIHEALRGMDAFIVSTVHDEIVVEAETSIAEEVAKIVSAAMVRAGEQIISKVPVVAEAAIADWWNH
jgi:DNA polymerase-1